MSRAACYWLVLILACTAAVSARSNICLAEGNIVYKPVQLYPSDCPGHTDDCTSYVYNYSAPLFKSKSVATLLPKNRESLVYMTQDENDNLDVVVITATTYKNTIINTQIKAVGASPAEILLQDDPGEDQWYWDSANNYGNFSWKLQPTYTDGLVIGHLKIIDNFCLTVTFIPNWVGAITSISLLTGTTSKTSRVFSKAMSTTANVPTSLEFCLYPKIVVSKTDATCGTLGSATAASLDNPASATFLWQKDGVTIGTTSTVTGLNAGLYVVTVTVQGCQIKREVTIETSVTNPIQVDYVVTAATLLLPGKVNLVLSGGVGPYSIKWRDLAGNLLATGLLSLTSQGGNITVTVSDGCSEVSVSIFIPSPLSCQAGSKRDSDGSCSICPTGTYSTSINSAKCNVCPPGSYNTRPGSAACIECPANTMGNGGSDDCVACPKNTVSTKGSSTCTPCPLGTDREAGASSCSPCDDGEFRCSSTGMCSACSAGTFGTEGKTTCESCNPGYYQPSVGQTSCLKCPANTYAAKGAIACTACPSGTFAPSGSSHLLACM